MKSLAVLAAALCLTGAALAADANKRYFIVGQVGSMKCAELIAKQNDNSVSVPFSHFMAGYITGLNRTSDDTYNLIGGAGFGVSELINGVLSFCTANGDALVETALFETLNANFEKRQKSE